MMALMTIANADKYGPDINAIAEHFTYTLARNLVPESKRARFDTKFKPKPPIVFAPVAKPDSTFLVTESRLALSQQMDDLLGLREWRLGQAELNTAQKGGGLGGLIIEGAPGIGKSELVIAGLRARDYQEEHDFINPTKKSNLFYRMPVSMPPSEKEAFLIKAFKEGAVVIIDEINSSPMMERLLNDLLMGKNPKGQPGDTVKPGFMIIATQNPVTMAGRRAASTAILRRCITHQLPEYKPEEIEHTLVSKGISPEKAQELIAAYQTNRDYAIKHQLSPVPNFRNLIELAEALILKKEEISNAPLSNTIYKFGMLFANILLLGSGIAALIVPASLVMPIVLTVAAGMSALCGLIQFGLGMCQSDTYNACKGLLNFLLAAALVACVCTVNPLIALGIAAIVVGVVQLISNYILLESPEDNLDQIPSAPGP
ncbi:MAG: hypothetical protein EBY16_10570 [Gammaproteobacteria bacterium]|nr:hypothetical protein [Gammaproteobacteria bacterium]